MIGVNVSLKRHSELTLSALAAPYVRSHWHLLLDVLRDAGSPRKSPATQFLSIKRSFIGRNATLEEREASAQTRRQQHYIPALQVCRRGSDQSELHNGSVCHTKGLVNEMLTLSV